MRRIIFTSRKIPNNSFVMRGYQMCDELTRLGYDCAVVQPEKLYDSSGCIIVWVRRVVHRLNRLLKNNNIIVYDPIDRICELYNYNLYKHVHAVIYPSNYQLGLKKGFIKDDCEFVLHHHYDPRIKLRTYNEFLLGYFGYSMSADHTRNLIPRINKWLNTSVFPPEDFFNRISCHYSVRTEAKGGGWRPTTKISTAAGSGCNIVVSRDTISEELLPKDYPYWVEDPHSIEETIQVINKAKNTFNKEEWYYGLDCMKNVREKTNITASAIKLGKYLEEIDAKWQA